MSLFSSDITSVIVSVLILLFSAIFHEIAHGAVAEYFGDDTAKDAGRLTLNPIPHIDPYFSILLPLFLRLSGSPVIFGAARPVPVNYNNLRNFRWGVFWVSIAGVLTNLFIAFVFALPLRFMHLNDTASSLLAEVSIINIYLAIINLIPVPPIDGSKALAALFGEKTIRAVARVEMRGWIGVLPFIILIYLFLLSPYSNAIFTPIANFFFHLVGLY